MSHYSEDRQGERHYPAGSSGFAPPRQSFRRSRHFVPLEPPPIEMPVNNRRYRWSSVSPPSPTGHSNISRRNAENRLAPWSLVEAPQLQTARTPRRLFADQELVGTKRVPPAGPEGLIWHPSPIPKMFDEDSIEDKPGTSLIAGLPPMPPNSGMQPCSSSAPNAFNPTPIGANALPPMEAFLFCDHPQASAVLSQLALFRTDNSMCDVELQVEGRSIVAHRCVLAAAIPYFRAMFTSLMLETKMSSIPVNDISYDSLRLLIDFVYTSTIRIDSENVQSLLFAASILQMDSVCGACQQFLSRFLTTGNCLSIRQFAEQHNCVDLLGNTDDFAVDHFTEIRVLDDFLQIPFSHLRDLIKRDDLQVETEEQVFETMISWVELDPSSRLEHFPHLLSLIRLPQMCLRYLCDVVKKHPYVGLYRDCMDQVSEALFEMLSPLKGSSLPLGMAIIEEGGGQYAAGGPLPISRPLSPETVSSRSKPRQAMAGVIFCAGGRGTLGDPFRSVEAFDWRKNQWIAVPEMIQQRRHVGVVSALGKLYAIGGHDGSMHLASAEMFDPASGGWRRVAPMNTSRRGIAVASLDNAIYAVGGLDDQTCFHTVERYDIELDSWSEVAKMCVQRGGVGVTALGKYLFAIGGNDGTRSLDSCERYDPLLNKWKLVARMANRRAGAGVCVLYGYLYAVGGFDDNAPLSTCERYDMVKDTWEQLASMSCPRGGVGVAAMGGLLYAIGGHDGARYLNTVESFDPTTNQWTPVSDIRECRAGSGVAWANCRIDNLLRPKQESGCAPSGGSQCI